MINRYFLALATLAGGTSVMAGLTSDDASLSLALAGVAVALLGGAALCAMTALMPPLPSLDARPADRTVQRLHHALRGDRLARQEVLDQVRARASGRSRMDAEEEDRLLDLSPADFQLYLERRLGEMERID